MENEVFQYEEQLRQIQQEIAICTDIDKRQSLCELQNDMTELIRLTKQATSPSNDDPLDAEYNLFRAELELDEEDAEQSNQIEIKQAVADLQKDFDSLPGTKCQAPFKHAWSDEPVYHNALIYKVEAEEVNSSEDIMVRVMFTHPTHKEMKPCSFYLEGDCKFSDEKCHFSHGECVSFSSLKEYKDPDFSTLGKGSRVLVLHKDDLWCRAKILSFHKEVYSIQLESNLKVDETQLQNIFPLDSSSKDSDGEDSSGLSSDEEDMQPCTSIATSDVVAKVFSAPPNSALGDWEKYTTGFGSRIMEQMGYVHGAGLGANADGRVDPVPAVIYPVGKSLDHCMMLKENAGGDQDLFKADRKMKRIQKKHEEALTRAYEREKQRTDVFTFLNQHIGMGTNHPAANSQTELRKESQKKLNVTSLQIADDVRKIEREIKSLHESLERNSASSSTNSSIRDKLRDSEHRLAKLQAAERKVTNELQQRQDRKKLAIF